MGMCTYQTPLPVIFLFMILWGFAYAAFGMMYDIMTEIIDYDVFLTGIKREAQYIYVKEFIPKFMEIPCTAIPFMVMQWFGYDPSRESTNCGDGDIFMSGYCQPKGVIWTLHLSVTVIPALFSFIMLLLVIHSKQREESQHEYISAGILEHAQGNAVVDPLFGHFVPPAPMVMDAPDNLDYVKGIIIERLKKLEDEHYRATGEVQQDIDGGIEGAHNMQPPVGQEKPTAETIGSKEWMIKRGLETPERAEGVHKSMAPAQRQKAREEKKKEEALKYQEYAVEPVPVVIGDDVPKKNSYYVKGAAAAGIENPHRLAKDEKLAVSGKKKVAGSDAAGGAGEGAVLGEGVHSMENDENLDSGPRPSKREYVDADEPPQMRGSGAAPSGRTAHAKYAHGAGAHAYDHDLAAIRVSRSRITQIFNWNVTLTLSIF